jgi:hypothetical protein
VQGETLHFYLLAENRELHAFSSFPGRVPLILRLDRRLPGVHARNLKRTTVFEAQAVAFDLPMSCLCLAV